MKRVSLSWRAVLSAFLLAVVIFSGVKSDTVRAVVPQPHGWVQVNTSGFGNPHNTFVASMAVYHNALYAGVTNRTDGGSVWRYVEGATWEPVRAPGQISNLNNPAVVAMHGFGQKLYVGTAWSNVEDYDLWSYKVWQFDGSEWKSVLSEGHPANGYTAFETFGGQIYLGVQYQRGNGIGSKILRSSSGDANTWEAVVVNDPTGYLGGINNPDAFGITDLKTFGSYLYAAVADFDNGVQVWRTQNGTDWTAVVSDGFEDLNNVDSGGLTESNGFLYLGVGNTTQGARIYRTSNGENWQEVFADDVTTTGNTKVEGIIVYRESLYAHTYNATSGMQVWVSDDGLSWRLDRAQGFGSHYNRNSLFNSAQAVYNDRLFIGTSNYDPAAGGQIFALVENVSYLPAVLR